MSGSGTGTKVTGGAGTGTRTPTLSPFQQQLADDLKNVFFNPDEFAIAATYTPKDGVPVPITILPGDEDLASQSPLPPGDEMIIMVMASEVSAPGNGDIYSINGVAWYHTQIISGGPLDGVYNIRLSRSSRRVINERTFLR